MTQTFRVIYTWPDDGRREVRYERVWPSVEADILKGDVEKLRRMASEGGYESPYSFEIHTEGGEVS